MRLRALCADLPGVHLAGPGDVGITGVEIDSRRVQPGALYVALPGVYLHGLKFVADAVTRGAAAVALPTAAEAPALDLPLVRLDQPRKGLARLAARFFGHPSRALDLVGVTGTNGKTTVTSMLVAIAKAAGRVPGLIGTGKQVIGDTVRETRFTTPEAPTIQALLAEMVAAGVTVAAMEVSSVGLEEDRVEETVFAATGWLNLTPDHLDYHPTFAAYARAKARLFDLRADDAVAVVNVEDPEGERLARRLDRVWRLRLETPSEVYYRELELSAHGCRGLLHTPLGEVHVRCPMPGRFNALNAAMAAALARSVGLSVEAIEAGLADIAVPGRMQSVPNDRGISVVVDYAHSADSLARVIETLRPLTAGRLICVFGCGGDRDPTKRVPMGQVAGAADAVVITNDNPRGEDPAAIAEAAAGGLRLAGRPPVIGPHDDGFCVELDRRAAIRMAIAAAQPGDTVLIAGKGHENYQEAKGERVRFDDVEEATEALR